MKLKPEDSTYNYGDLPLIHSDVYSVEEELFKLAANYFYDSEKEEVSLSTLRPTIFGFVSQTASMIIKNGVYHRNSLYSELFLNSATMDESVYAFAKEQNKKIALARPATIMLSVGIKEADILAYADTVFNDTSNRIFKIDKLSKIYLDKIAYMLPNSVVISCKKNNNSGVVGGSWQYTANYRLDDYNLKEYSVKNPYIKIFRKSSGGENYLIMELRAYQVAYREVAEDMYESDVTALLTWTLNFTDQLAGFKVENRKSNSIIFDEIENGVFNSFQAPTHLDEYYYYNYPSSTQVEVYFGNPPEYRPMYGSKMRFRTYSTLGAKGNFSYNGPVNFSLVTPEEDIKNYGYTDKSPVKVICKNISDSTGGTNRPTTTEIKEELIKDKLIRNNLITETDLNNYFNETIVRTSVNGGSVVFFKHRDDIIRRLFTAFLLLRDNYGRVVPTNTIDILVDYAKIEPTFNCLKPGSVIIYDNLQRVYRLLEKGEYPDEYLKDNRMFIYSLPYLLSFKVDPFPRVIYYSVDTDLEHPVNYKSNPIFAWESLLNYFNVQRGSIFDQQYYFSTNLITNIDNYGTALDGTSKPSSYLKLRVVIKDPVKQTYIAAFDLEPERGSKTTYSTYLSTKDEIDNDGNMILYTMGSKNNLRSMSGEVIQSVRIPEVVDFEIYILYDAIGCEGSGSSSELVESSLAAYPVIAKMQDLYGTHPDTGAAYRYGVAGMFVHSEEDNYSLFYNMSDYIQSEVNINANAALLFKNIPVIGTKYYLDRNNYVEVQRVLKVYHTLLADSIKLLENNTLISTKFYNTYGVSKLYDSDSTNLFLELKIKLSSQYSTELDEQIRATIVSYIENANKTKVVDFSSIVTLLRENFKEILLINIVGINKLGVQAIEQLPNIRLEKMTNAELRNYVPEFLNVNMEHNNGVLTYSIKLTYI